MSKPVMPKLAEEKLRAYGVSTPVLNMLQEVEQATMEAKLAIMKAETRKEVCAAVQMFAAALAGHNTGWQQLSETARLTEMKLND